MSQKWKKKGTVKKGEKVVSSPAPLPPVAKTEECPPVPSAAPATATTTPGETVDEITKRKERDDKIYEGFRSDILKSEGDYGKEYDKWLLTLAGAGLAFSLNYVKDYRGAVAAKSPLTYLPLLYTAWIAFAGTSFLLVTNMLLSYSAHKEYRRIADTMYKAYDAAKDFWQRVEDRMNAVKRNKCVEVFNWISWFLFTAGLVTLVLFIFFNSQLAQERSSEMADQPKPQFISTVKKDDMRSTSTAPTPRTVPQKEGAAPSTQPTTKPQK